MDPIGKKQWAIPGGFVPVDSTGPEPEMVSHDKLCMLNAGEEMASVEITLYYADGHTAGPYPLTVAPRRVRHVRVNDLIDPYAPPLGEEYAAVVEATVPIVVQFSGQDTRQTENATLSTIAYGEQ
ncbi:MAG: sensory rhodopsin transducer [Euryarchaeota archaeon]|nr:sensory rhodopsin transducer [Euryarchaeota archaeon]